LANTQYDVAIEYYFVLQDYENGSRYMELAINSYQKVLQAEPDNIYVRTDMATLAYYVGNNELAKENFEKAIAQDPTFINARNNYGEFLLNSLGDTEGAIAQWQAILEMNPDPGTKSSIEAKINKAQSAAKQ